MTQQTTPLNYSSPLPPPLQCGFCGRPLGPQFYRVALRPACEQCAAQGLQINDQHRLRLASTLRGLLFAFGAAILCGAAWAAIGIMSGSPIGIVAIGVGYVVARATLIGSKQSRNEATRVIAIVCSLAGVFLGTSFTILWGFLSTPELAALARVHPWQVLELAFIQIPAHSFRAFDLIWFGLAALQAWRYTRPILVNIEGPFATGPAVATMPMPVESYFNPTPQSSAPARRPRAPLAQAIMVTVVSALISIVVYSQQQGLLFAAGSVLCILIHELGHTLACLAYGLPASSPIFIPYVGALISLRAQPPNAKVESVIGMAGPLGGLLAATACYVWFLKTHSPMAAALVDFGAMINLFNLLPVHPMDGGRIARGVAPAFWAIVLPLLAYGYWAAPLFGIERKLATLLAIVTVTGIGWTLKRRQGPYYDTSIPAGWMMGFTYLGTAVVLLWMWHQVQPFASIW